MSAHTPLNGVLERHELPVRTSVLLNNEGLRQISTALVGIKTCGDILAHRETEMGEGLPTFCGQTAHGLLAAIATCATAIEAQVNAADTEGALMLKGDDAREIDAQAWRAWHRNQMQPNQPQTHAQQAQAATEIVANAGSKEVGHGL